MLDIAEHKYLIIIYSVTTHIIAICSIHCEFTCTLYTAASNLHSY